MLWLVCCKPGLWIGSHILIQAVFSSTSWSPSLQIPNLDPTYFVSNIILISRVSDFPRAKKLFCSFQIPWNSAMSICNTEILPSPYLHWLIYVVGLGEKRLIYFHPNQQLRIFIQAPTDNSLRDPIQNDSPVLDPYKNTTRVRTAYVQLFTLARMRACRSVHCVVHKQAATALSLR